MTDPETTPDRRGEGGADRPDLPQPTLLNIVLLALSLGFWVLLGWKLSHWFGLP